MCSSTFRAVMRIVLSCFDQLSSYPSGARNPKLPFQRRETAHPFLRAQKDNDSRERHGRRRSGRSEKIRKEAFSPESGSWSVGSSSSSNTANQTPPFSHGHHLDVDGVLSLQDFRQSHRRSPPASSRAAGMDHNGTLEERNVCLRDRIRRDSRFSHSEANVFSHELTRNASMKEDAESRNERDMFQKRTVPMAQSGKASTVATNQDKRFGTKTLNQFRFRNSRPHVSFPNRKQLLCLASGCCHSRLV